MWQSAVALVKLIYLTTADFPDHERYGLTAQTRRAGISVVANIAEGSARRGARAFAAYCDVAYGSLKELEALLMVATELGFLDPETLAHCRRETASVARQLYALGARLRSASRH